MGAKLAQLYQSSYTQESHEESAGRRVLSFAGETFFNPQVSFKGKVIRKQYSSLGSVRKAEMQDRKKENRVLETKKS